MENKGCEVIQLPGIRWRRICSLFEALEHSVSCCILLCIYLLTKYWDTCARLKNIRVSCRYTFSTRDTRKKIIPPKRYRVVRGSAIVKQLKENKASESPTAASRLSSFAECDRFSEREKIHLRRANRWARAEIEWNWLAANC